MMSGTMMMRRSTFEARRVSWAALGMTLRRYQPIWTQIKSTHLGPGNYVAVGIVGSGSMGVVLKTLDRALDRYVAIKVLAPHLATSGAAVIHDNVIEIHGVANKDGLPYLVVPYVSGP